MAEEYTLPEAPASANTRVTLPSGRQYQITIRTEKNLLDKIAALDLELDNRGWNVPTWQVEKKDGADFLQETKDLGNCEKCGAKNLMSKKGNTYCSAKCWLKE